MSEHTEDYNPEETFDEYEYQGEGDYDEHAWGTEVTEIVETYPEVFTSAFANFFVLAQETLDIGEEEACVLTHPQALQFIQRIGLDSRATDVVEETHLEHYECNELYSIIESTGCFDDANISDVRQFKNIASVLIILKSFTSAGSFVSPEHRVDGETRFKFGPVQGDGVSFFKFALNKSLDATQEKIFQEHPEAFFSCSCDIELVSKEALEFVKDCFTLMVDVVGVFTRQIGSGLKVQFDTLPESENHLRITLTGNNFREPLQGNILYALDFVNGILPEFNVACKWDCSLKNALYKPVKELVNCEVDVSIPRLGIQPSLITMACEQIESTVEQLFPGENLLQNVSDFDKLKEGKTDVELNFTTVVQKAFEKCGDLFDPASELHVIVNHFAPIGAELLFGIVEVDPALQPVDVVKGIASLIELIKKIVARDFVDCTSVSVRTRQGHGFTQQSQNFMNVEVLFTFLKDLLTVIAKAM